MEDYSGVGFFGLEEKPNVKLVQVPPVTFRVTMVRFNTSSDIQHQIDNILAHQHSHLRGPKTERFVVVLNEGGLFFARFLFLL